MIGNQQPISWWWSCKDAWSCGERAQPCGACERRWSYGPLEPVDIVAAAEAEAQQPEDSNRWAARERPQGPEVAEHRLPAPEAEPPNKPRHRRAQPNTLPANKHADTNNDAIREHSQPPLAAGHNNHSQTRIPPPQTHRPGRPAHSRPVRQESATICFSYFSPY